MRRKQGGPVKRDPGRGPRRPRQTERSGPTRRSILTDFPYINCYASRGARAIEADNWLAFSPGFWMLSLACGANRSYNVATRWKPMRFEWDEEKRLSNIAKHGFDFIRAARLFDGRPELDAQSGSTLSLARRSVSPWTGAQDFKHWRTGRRNDRGGLDAARRRCLLDYFGEAGER